MITLNFPWERGRPARIERLAGQRPALPGRPLVLFIVLAAAIARAADLPTLWAERLKSVVAVEYLTETEVARQPTNAMGTVIDTQGTIILPPGAIDARAATWQLKEFKIYLPGNSDSTPGEYLGPDAFTGWHFVRAQESLRAKLTPVTKFAPKSPRKPLAVADRVWGIGLRPKDEDFQPYFLQSYLALVQAQPQRTGVSHQDIAAPGLPVFDLDGNLVGLALASFGESYLQFTRGGRAQPVVLINVEESSAFLLADEVLPYLGRIPKNLSGRPLAWLGAYGLETMDREVAKFLNLSSQSGVVVSEVLEGSPAEKAGIKARDIILAVDRKPLPQFKPDRAVVTFVEREISRRQPGDRMPITVLRGTERLELEATLGDEPKLVREAERKYFDRLGFTAREMVFDDAVERRVKVADVSGVIAHYVKSSSPVAVAGLRPDDWIREIDGAEVKTFADASTRLAEIEKDDQRPEFVLLVSRGGETAVLRVKLR